MKKQKTIEIKIKDIKHIENSRLRENDDVSDLMFDIEQRGLLQNIGIRQNDNALIFGNRRVSAFTKLGYDTIRADVFIDVSDEDLLIANLAENMKRKNIGSIEIGRICSILQKKGLKSNEIARRLAIGTNRVSSCIAAYAVTVGTPFEHIVMHGFRNKHSGIISESLIWTVQNSLSKFRKLSKDDWNIILPAIEKGDLTQEKISQLRKILACSKHLTIKEALKILKNCQISHIWFHLDTAELNKALTLEKCSNAKELINHIIRKYNKDLIF